MDPRLRMRALRRVLRLPRARRRLNDRHSDRRSRSSLTPEPRQDLRRARRRILRHPILNPRRHRRPVPRRERLRPLPLTRIDHHMPRHLSHAPHHSPHSHDASNSHHGQHGYYPGRKPRKYAREGVVGASRATPSERSCVADGPEPCRESSDRAMREGLRKEIRRARTILPTGPRRSERRERRLAQGNSAFLCSRRTGGKVRHATAGKLRRTRHAALACAGLSRLRGHSTRTRRRVPLCRAWCHLESAGVSLHSH